MALTLADLQTEVSHALGGSLASALSSTVIVNEAGRAFYAAHDWFFRRRADRYLAYSVLSIENADWTEATRTLTLSAAFSTYLHVAGAKFTATGGVGVTTGEYVIQSKTSDNALVLLTSLSTDAVNLTGVVDGTLALPYVLLPSDFGELLSLESGDAIDSDVLIVSQREIGRLRTSDSASNARIRAAIVYPGRDDVTDSFGPPRLEIHPTPSASDNDALVMSYKADWTELSTSTDKVAVPLYGEMLLKEFVKAHALGVEEADGGGSVSRRISEILQSPYFATVVRRDQKQQNTFGPIRNTNWQKAQRGRSNTYSQTRNGLVSDPA